ncbi:MAG TPA: M56 family metallopeptidase [Pirellulales bacterium]|nr:M56 family metallopeptidase [Pirellulales bacterium]
MAWQALCWQWLIQSALGSLILYGCACLALAWRRQPVQRLRLIELALLASFAAPGLGFLPGAPGWSLGGLDLGWKDNVPAADAHSPSPSREPAVASSRHPFPISIREGASAFGPVAAIMPWTPRALKQAALVVYALAAAGLFLRWALGAYNLRCLAQTARPAPLTARQALAELAGSDAARVTLLASPRLDAPIVFGWRKPVIVLPENLCDGQDPAALRYCLAHEWSHVERGDARVWYLAALAQFAFFYQPLFWSLRRQLRLCQDYLADARAAEQGAAVEDYAEYLLAVARRRLTAQPAPALGFGDRRSNLYRRVVMLVKRREPLERRCRTAWNGAFTLATVALAMGVSSLRLGADENRRAVSQSRPASALTATAMDAAADPQPLSLGGRIIDHDTGKPIEGATIVVRRRELGPGGNRVLQETRHQADAEGDYSFMISKEQLAKGWLYVEFDVEHPGFAPQGGMGCAIDALRDRKPSGARPFFAQIALRRSEPVTGVLETFAGRPAAGVDVLAYSQGDGKPWEYGAFARTKTDAEGRFRVALATPGDGVLYLQPAGAPPAMYVMHHRRGDLGRIRLPSGIARRDLRLDPPAVSSPSDLAAAKRSSAPIE